jgi:hypothetical protein
MTTHSVIPYSISVDIPRSKMISAYCGVKSSSNMKSVIIIAAFCFGAFAQDIWVSKDSVRVPRALPNGWVNDSFTIKNLGSSPVWLDSAKILPGFKNAFAQRQGLGPAARRRACAAAAMPCQRPESCQGMGRIGPEENKAVHLLA